jgi:aspartate aminotransferase
MLAYGSDSSAIKDDRLVITQSISGTGALRIGGEFLARFYPSGKRIFIPTPSWANHNAVFKDSGLEVEKYRYYNKDTIGLDFDGMLADLKAAPEESIVLLHACAHNPTGIDPSEDQWRKISDVVKEKRHYPFFDMAYQGFASGDTKRDAFAVRHFVQEGHQICLAQSFAKNMVTLHGHREAMVLKYSGTLRRARRRLLHRVRISRGEETRGFAGQNPRPTTLFQSSSARCPNRLRDPQ